MLINNITIRGFRSFGNNEQTIKLIPDIGQLILLAGSNGSGKTSLLSSFDYALYGKAKGKKKALTLSSLPNRINKELFTSIKFQSEGTEVEIRRGINPNMLELYENDILYDRAGKSNIDDRIQKHIGLDLETFKSFISLSINDFKNFISLSTEEKRLLLDKLFNLEAINILNNVLKGIASENKKQIEILDREISSYQASIDSIKRNLDKTKDSEYKNLSSEISKTKEDIISRKSEWESLKEKKLKIEAKEKELNTTIDNQKSEYSTCISEIKFCQKSIDLYNSGKCPTCQSNLCGEEHNSIKQSYLDKLTKLTELELELKTSIKDWSEKKVKLRSISDQNSSLYGELTSMLRNLKFNLDTLEAKSKEDMVSESIQKFTDSINEIQSNQQLSKEKTEICQEKMLYHKELSKVFSEDGVKKVIIRNIIDPINHFVSENIKKIGLPFEVVLDQTFDAKVYHLGQEIDPETLSTGEAKKVNICILLAYLKLIRLKRNLNILFLDEVFSSIDVESIDLILGLLKDFANEYKINIFLVHHSILNSEHFDRILHIEKEIFTKITEVVKQ